MLEIGFDVCFFVIVVTSARQVLINVHGTHAAVSALQNGIAQKGCIRRR